MEDNRYANGDNPQDISCEEDTQKGKFLTFHLGTESYGVEIRFVTEIIGIQTITPIPEMPHYIKGIINLRGRIIPVMDVRLRFNMPIREYDERTCIVVTDMGQYSIGLIVDRVAEVVTLGAQDLVDPPDFKQGLQNKFFKSIGKTEGDVKLILDCDKLLTQDIKEELEGGIPQL